VFKGGIIEEETPKIVKQRQSGYQGSRPAAKEIPEPKIPITGGRNPRRTKNMEV
jgi:hypothetical protein